MRKYKIFRKVTSDIRASWCEVSETESRILLKNHVSHFDISLHYQDGDIVKADRDTLISSGYSIVYHPDNELLT